MKKLFTLVSLLLILSAALVAQDWSLSPNYGDVSLDSGFLPDPYEVDLVAGGGVDLSDIGYYGYITEAPDFDLRFESGSFPLTIRVESEGDTVLLINDPSGNWHFSDDEDGLDPAITFNNPEDGLYDIWVGTVYYDEYLSSTLIITEM